MSNKTKASSSANAVAKPFLSSSPFFGTAPVCEFPDSKLTYVLSWVGSAASVVFVQIRWHVVILPLVLAQNCVYFTACSDYLFSNCNFFGTKKDKELHSLLIPKIKHWASMINTSVVRPNLFHINVESTYCQSYCTTITVLFFVYL